MQNDSKTAATDERDTLSRALDMMLDECIEIWQITTREPVNDPDGECVHFERFE